MRYFINIDNVSAKDWKLTIQEAYLFAWIWTLPSWADKVIINNSEYFFASRKKIVEDIPMVSEKEDTIYRYLKSLESKKLIINAKVHGKDYIMISEEGKKWKISSPVSDQHPSVGQKSECRKRIRKVDRNPSIGSVSELNSDADPTDNNINIYITTEPKVSVPFQETASDFVQVEVEEVPPGTTQSSAPAAKVKKRSKSRKLDPSEYSIVTKMQIAVKELNKEHGWDGADASAAKKLASKINTIWFENTGLYPNDDEILKYFRKMVQNIPKYWDGIWDVKGLNSSFTKISMAMKKPVSNGKTIDAMIEIRQISEKRLKEGRVKTFNDQ